MVRMRDGGGGEFEPTLRYRWHNFLALTRARVMDLVSRAEDAYADHVAFRGATAIDGTQTSNSIWGATRSGKCINRFTEEETLRWMEEFCTDKWVIVRRDRGLPVMRNFYRGKRVILFRSSTDAMAFKMRWG